MARLTTKASLIVTLTDTTKTTLIPSLASTAASSRLRGLVLVQVIFHNPDTATATFRLFVNDGTTSSEFWKETLLTDSSNFRDIRLNLSPGHSLEVQLDTVPVTNNPKAIGTSDALIHEGSGFRKGPSV